VREEAFIQYFLRHTFYSIKLYFCEIEISFIYCNRNFGNACLYLNSKRYRYYVIKVYGVGECEGKPFCLPHLSRR